MLSQGSEPRFRRHQHRRKWGDLGSFRGVNQQLRSRPETPGLVERPWPLDFEAAYRLGWRAAHDQVLGVGVRPGGLGDQGVSHRAQTSLGCVRPRWRDREDDHRPRGRRHPRRAGPYGSSLRTQRSPSRRRRRTTSRRPPARDPHVRCAPPRPLLARRMPNLNRQFAGPAGLSGGAGRLANNETLHRHGMLGELDPLDPKPPACRRSAGTRDRTAPGRRAR